MDDRVSLVAGKGAARASGRQGDLDRSGLIRMTGSSRGSKGIGTPRRSRPAGPSRENDVRCLAARASGRQGDLD
jgi:hypothetical protein